MCTKCLIAVFIVVFCNCSIRIHRRRGGDWCCYNKNKTDIITRYEELRDRIVCQ